jgi:hypothetical protein
MRLLTADKAAHEQGTELTQGTTPEPATVSALVRAGYQAKSACRRCERRF